MGDVGKTVVAIQGNQVKREILGADQDGYVLTWVNSDDKWEAKPTNIPSPFTKVPDASTFVDQGFGGTCSDSFGNVVVIGSAGGDIAQQFVRPLATNKLVIAFLQILGPGGSSAVAGAGLTWRVDDAGSSSSFVTFAMHYSGDNVARLNVRNWPDENLGNFASSVFNGSNSMLSCNGIWMKAEIADGYRTCSISPNGINWIQVYQTTDTNFITPTHIGFFVDPNGSDIQLICQSWYES